MKRKREFQSNSLHKEKVNPFEIRVNKVKHNVLGRRVCKNEIGKPFESRNKAFKKRKSTLFGEYKRKDKRGKGVVDRRLKDTATTGVELRKASVWKMKNAINCENASLTHKGINLSDIALKESYSDLEDDDNEVDLLRRGDYVESAHFGGGESGAAKSAKEFMDEIFDEKRRKQVEKEANIELTEKLDKDWLSIKNLLQHKGLKSEATESTSDDYDVLVKQLAFTDNERKPKLEIMAKNEKNNPGKSIGKNQLFLEKVNEMLSCNDVIRVSSILDCLCEYQNLNFETINTLKLVTQEMRHISLQSFSILLLCSRLSGLKDCYYAKSLQLIRNTKLNSIANIVKCMCLIQLLMTTCGNSFFPEVIQTIQNILVLCLGEKFTSFFIPVFDVTKMKRNDILLVSLSSCTANIEALDLSFKHVFDSAVTFPSSDSFKIGVIKALIELISTVACKYKSLASFNEIFCNILFLTENLYERYADHPFSIDVKVILREKTEKSFLFREKRKPIMLPLYEPRIESSRRQESNKKLVKKYKREFKGAQRELKKDTVFLKDVWLSETLKKDKDRKQKVKQLFAELATESSLYKKKK